MFEAFLSLSTIDKIGFTITFIVLVPFAVGVLLLAIDTLFKSCWSCKTFGWHNGKGGPNTFDGCSIGGTCSKCGKEVLQDSQGNWF